MKPERQNMTFPCRPSSMMLLGAGLFFLGCMTVLGHRASTNTKGLSLNGIIEFSPAGASIFYGVLAVLSLIFVVLALWTIIALKIRAVPDVMLTAGAISFPVGFPFKRAFELPYSQITGLSRSDISGQRLLIIQSKTKKHQITLNWLGSKEAEARLVQELADRLASVSESRQA